LQAKGGAQSASETQLPPSPLSGQPGPPSGVGVDATQVLLARSQLRPEQQLTSVQLSATAAHPPPSGTLLEPEEDPEEELLLLEGQPARQTVVAWPLLLPPWLPLLPPTLELAVLLDELLLVEEPLLELPPLDPVPPPASGTAVEPEQAARVSPSAATPRHDRRKDFMAAPPQPT
jgi:hypothetical protein